MDSIYTTKRPTIEAEVARAIKVASGHCCAINSVLSTLTWKFTISIATVKITIQATYSFSATNIIKWRTPTSLIEKR
jgi:hypothetical protein